MPATVVRNLVGSIGAESGAGLRLGAKYRVTTFGIFGFACVSSPTLWDAISLALRYLASRAQRHEEG